MGDLALKTRLFDAPFVDQISATHSLENCEEEAKIIGNESDASSERPKKFDRLALVYYGETEKSRIERLRDFRIRLQQDDPQLLVDLPQEGDLFLLKMLRAGGFTVDGAVRLLRSYVKMISDGPLYFSPIFDPKLKLIRSGFHQNLHDVLPHRDRHGRRVHILRPGKWDPDDQPFNVVFCCGFIMGELLAMESRTQIAGVTAVVDASDFGFKHFKSLSLQDLKHAAMFAQDHFPLWFRGIHIVNVPRFGEMVFRILKPMLHQRVRDTIVFHQSLQSLHNHVDSGILPGELGGTSGVDKVDNAISASAALQMSDYFQRLKSYVFKDQYM